MELQEVEIQIAELAERVDRLRALYEQYFSGIEKLEPLVLRKEVDRRLFALRRLQIRNTALRFKLQSIVQRYNTFQQYWARICREIENGTYHRDVARAAARFGDEATQTALGRKRQAMFEKGMQKRAEREAARQTSIREVERAMAEGLAEDSADEAADSVPESSQSGLRPAVQPAPAGAHPFGARGLGRGPGINPLHRNPFASRDAATPPAEPPSRPGPRPVPAPSPVGKDGELTDGRLKEIYSAYVDSKRKRGESTAAITYEGLAKTLRSTAPQLRAKHKAKAVDFEVVVRDGKTMIRPVLK